MQIVGTNPCSWYIHHRCILYWNSRTLHQISIYENEECKTMKIYQSMMKIMVVYTKEGKSYCFEKANTKGERWIDSWFCHFINAFISDSYSFWCSNYVAPSDRSFCMCFLFIKRTGCTEKLQNSIASFLQRSAKCAFVSLINSEHA